MPLVLRLVLIQAAQSESQYTSITSQARESFLNPVPYSAVPSTYFTIRFTFLMDKPVGVARSLAHSFVAYLMSALSWATNNSLPTAVR